ncbi:MAG TPA: hypothetical protein PLL20_17060 [Phycisphaerae bacterium]|nr:hypothetical protein [Phycisphaerae bacterium]HRR85512.1 hypothetical protein [Phycisphaerae bacterium]
MANDDFAGLIRQVTTPLEEQGVVYAITGSVASSIHGEPRASIDVDIVMNMRPNQVSRLVADLGPRFYADADVIRQACVDHSMTNVIHRKTSLKFDLSMLPDTPYYREVLRRRVWVEYPESDLRICVVSAEDIVLMKLLWRKTTGSRKQWENALSVVRTQRTRLDWTYLRGWAAELGIKTDLEELAREAGI